MSSGRASGSFLFERLPVFRSAMSPNPHADPVRISRDLLMASSPVHAYAKSLSRRPSRLGIKLKPTSSARDKPDAGEQPQVEAGAAVDVAGRGKGKAKGKQRGAAPQRRAKRAGAGVFAHTTKPDFRHVKSRVDCGPIKRKKPQKVAPEVPYMIVRPGTSSTVGSLGGGSSVHSLTRVKSMGAMVTSQQRRTSAQRDGHGTPTARRVQGWGIWATTHDPATDSLRPPSRQSTVPARTRKRLRQQHRLFRAPITGRQPCLSPPLPGQREDACFKFKTKRFPEIPPSSDVPPACGFFRPTCSEDMGPGRYVAAAHHRPRSCYPQMPRA